MLIITYMTFIMLNVGKYQHDRQQKTTKGGDRMVRIKELRKQKGMTQEALAAFTGINRVSIAKYETGKTTPSLNTAEKLAAALGVTVDELLKGD